MEAESGRARSFLRTLIRRLDADGAVFWRVEGGTKLSSGVSVFLENKDRGVENMGEANYPKSD